MTSTAGFESGRAKGMTKRHTPNTPESPTFLGGQFCPDLNPGVQRVWQSDTKDGYDRSTYKGPDLNPGHTKDKRDRPSPIARAWIGLLCNLEQFFIFHTMSFSNSYD